MAGKRRGGDRQTPRKSRKGLRAFDDDFCQETRLQVNKKRSRIVVVTQGADPVIVVNDDDVQIFPVPPLDPAQIVDTTGAGDAFCGGFFAQLIQRKSLAECVRCGTWAASIVIAHHGCTFPSDLSYST